MNQNIRPNIIPFAGSLVQSTYINGQKPTSRSIAPPVQIDDTIILFPWVDTLEESFIEKVQPFWLTTKDDILAALFSSLKTNYPFQYETLYIMFWGSLTTAIALYFTNKHSPNHGNFFYYFMMLLAWNISLAFFIYFFSKITGVRELTILKHLTMISTSYIFTLLPLILISCNIGYTRVFFCSIYLCLLSFLLIKNYKNYWQLSLGLAMVLSCIIVVCNIIQIYLLFYLGSMNGENLTQLRRNHHLLVPT